MRNFAYRKKLRTLLSTKVWIAMNRYLITLLLFVTGSTLCSIAQDDLYFVPKKKKEVRKTDAPTVNEYDNWADNRTSSIDVDAYNRRGTSSKTDESAYYPEESDNESYTNRIVRFHAPGVTVVSSPYYTEYIDVYADPWYSFYAPYGWYDYTWSSHYGWHYSWGWNRPYHWYYSCYDPWWGWHGHHHPSYHHAWYPHYGGGHHHHYVPSRPAPRRPVASNRGYRPSTERGTRPSANRRPSENRNSVTTNRNNASTNRNTVSTDRNSRKPSSTTVSPSRNERPQRVMGGGNNGGSRPQRSVGSSGGRRR